MTNCSRLRKVELRTLILVGVLGFLILGAAPAEINGGRKMKMNGALIVGNTKHRYLRREHVVGNYYTRRLKKQSRAGSKPDLISNKRKVPNGPDPIHNRRAGNSRQPPGRA